MNLLWHIVRKDCARHRGWLALWVAVLAGRVACGFLAAHQLTDERNLAFARINLAYNALLLASAGLVCVIALPAFFVGACADSLGRALLWTLVPLAFAAFGVGPFFASLGRVSLKPFVQLAAVAAATLGLASVTRYLTRGVVAPLGVLLLGSLLCSPVVAVWNTMERTSSVPSDRERKLPPGMSVRLNRVSAEVSPRDSGGDSHAVLMLSAAAEGLPNGRELRVVEWQHRWQPSEGRPYVIRNTSGNIAAFSGKWGRETPIREVLNVRDRIADPETERWIEEVRSRRGFSAPPTSSEPNAQWLGYGLGIERARVLQMQESSTRYEAVLRLEMVRPELIAELKPAPNDWHRGRGRAFRLQRVTQNERSAGLHWIQTRPAGVFETLSSPQWHAAVPNRPREAACIFPATGAAARRCCRSHPRR